MAPNFQQIFPANAGLFVCGVKFSLSWMHETAIKIKLSVAERGIVQPAQPRCCNQFTEQGVLHGKQ